MSVNVQSTARPILDPARYSLQDHERQFLELLTGIYDDDELKKHVLAVQAKAYQISAVVVVGNDTRKVAVDGWPAENIVASDLRGEFWDCGHELFKSTPESFPATFIAGDVFDSSMLDMSDIQADAEAKQPPSIRPLRGLTSLTPLKHQVSAIHASALFHLFPEEGQRELARRLASLLLPEKGSIIFGQHGAMLEKGFRVEKKRSTDPLFEVRQAAMFCHSPETWKKMWEEDIFGPGESGWQRPEEMKIKVEAELKQVERWDADLVDNDAKPYFVMNWSVEVL
ncbi:Methyltransferase adrK [Psilocybe cubensis]|uniref:Methyltransferase adrK n=1 Tax=Psilocybe cubensis TaxID=181762 RepID=A0ACB8H0C7_PSICU|nr:Methyltransferase adrK [Psilocybe cubensis]KAH9481458.1 Methyltransferase adrK [Psilocybe cubensis]